MSAFEPDYRAARARFRGAAAARGLTLSAWPIGDADLTIDVASGGDDGGRRAFLGISGTHGQEAFAGSAAQIAFLEDGWVAPPADTRIVFVHALNPWGFAHGHRGDADNVDLSRNFIDFAAGPPPANAIYADLHAIGATKHWDTTAGAAIDAAMSAFVDRVGAAATISAATGGQYDFPDGINYGGRAPAASHRAFEAICAHHLAEVDRLLLIEWHTGFGAYGEPFYVCPLSAASAELALTRSWFAHPTIGRSGAAFAAGAAPDWHGLVYEGLRRFLPGTRIAGSIVEFGTYPNAEVGEALRIDRWLRFGTGSDEERARLRTVMMERLNPSDPAWRAAVERIGVDIHARAFVGLGGWAG